MKRRDFLKDDATPVTYITPRQLARGLLTGLIREPITPPSIERGLEDKHGPDFDIATIPVKRLE